ncbi:hypothetical protein ABZ942_18080 [Nocardia sp. NPDC046473]|uniref:hypothetical protein n=1 Tax=Nocardia sp. NPDC046473 TaxID=3155733 RepID=UPI0033D2E07E
MNQRGDLRVIVSDLLPELTELLKESISIPSIAFPGYPVENVRRAHDRVADELRRFGVDDIRVLRLPDTAPVVYGRIPAPPGAPTVLVYGHYDVQPPGAESFAVGARR